MGRTPSTRLKVSTKMTSPRVGAWTSRAVPSAAGDRKKVTFTFAYPPAPRPVDPCYFGIPETVRADVTCVLRGARGAGGGRGREVRVTLRCRLLPPPRTAEEIAAAEADGGEAAQSFRGGGSRRRGRGGRRRRRRRLSAFVLERASSISLEVRVLLLIISIVFDAHSPPTYVAHLLRLLLHVREVEEERVRVEHHPVVALAHRLRDVPRRFDPSQGDESEVGRGGRRTMSFADLASPSALMTADRLSCLAFSTMNLARSASCCATCLASMAAVYSRPKVSAVMDTSSRSMFRRRRVG